MHWRNITLRIRWIYLRKRIQWDVSGVIKVKFNQDGSVARFKARFVAIGYAQAYSVDYSNTFLTVAKLTFVHLFISLAT